MQSSSGHWITDNSLNNWERLKRLSFIVESQIPFKQASFSAPDDQNIRFVHGSESSTELNELIRLTYAMGLVDPQFFQADLNLNISTDEIEKLDQDNLPHFITTIVRKDRLDEGLLQEEVNSKRLLRLCRRAYSLAILMNGWPRHFPITASSGIEIGLMVRSLNHTYEGRTTGGRRQCPAKNCPGWLVGVLWESGQQMHICTEGWHYDPSSMEIHIIGGGEISARFVSPKPLGTPILPKDQWINRADLLKSRAWS